MVKTKAEKARVGDTVLYAADEKHHTRTVKGDAETHGSVHHHALREFAGIVGRVHEDGTADVWIFVPGMQHGGKWIEKAAEGEGHGEFKLAE